MQRGAALRALGIAEQGRCGGVRQRAVVGAETAELRHPQGLAQLALAERGIELPRRASGARRAVHLQCRRCIGFVEQHFSRLDARQPRRQLVEAAFGERTTPAGQAQPRQPTTCAARVTRQREQRGVAAFGEQLTVGDRSRRDHACDLALHRPLGRGHVAHLLGDGDRLTELDQLGEVALQRLRRHAGHHHRLAGAGTARGEGDVQQAIRTPRVVVEQLVEVAHPVQHQRVGMLRLDAQVLLHHWSVCGEIFHYLRVKDLYSHAIELYLKSFLLMNDVSLDDLKELDARSSRLGSR